jgi:hypothetical protein
MKGKVQLRVISACGIIDDIKMGIRVLWCSLYPTGSG